MPPTTTPRRIRLRRTKGWRMPDNTISVARPSYWGNPWHVGRDGDARQCVAHFRRMATRCAVVHWPRDAADSERSVRFANTEFIRAQLAGKNLACWCALDQPCHADVLLEIANGTSEVSPLEWASTLEYLAP